MCIKDMAGLLLPYVTEELISKLKLSTKLPIELHTHYTSGMASMSVLKAVEAGCDIVYKNGLTVKGSPMTDMYLKQRGEIWNLANNGKDDEARSLYLEQIREHRDDALGVAFMRMLRSPAWLTVTSEKKLIESLGDEVKYDFRIQRRLNHLRAFQPSDEGDMFLDFAVEYDGKTTRLSDYVGRGQ